MPKYTTSRLQPLDAGIIRAFNCKYRKLLVKFKYVVSRVDEGKRASDIIQNVTILRAIHWLQASEKAIQQCFRKCGFKATHTTDLDNGIDEEFQSTFQHLSCSEDVSLKEFIGFDDNLVTLENEINNDLVDWGETSCDEAARKVLPIKRQASVEEQSESEESDEEEDDI